ncbi:molybdopterin-dependent oxidoreductase [Modestobacter sp. I12A-02628]|uniref:Molybdopterin-dependent oxidoreductase n=1 Tax=Goekera deserti TaxID=2497753 RepID=A0A7K3W9E2_9ACTN|nr:molybdopterin-dependent oxidoreductase [Goekera deserti]MPQ98657.1 molybdopterin-dependent oxidoreductase [Goekera deserti]NDI49219.1 molybdopterin-dependent oxidoreductase [Goekera deserti]NEL52957.1 molybdopterin-dependent oxidoreductase [Goekera deserti]
MAPREPAPGRAPAGEPGGTPVSGGSLRLRGRRGLFRASTRVTNTALLVVLLAAYASGTVSELTGAAGGWAVAAVHGVLGVLTVLLLPWKRRVVRAGLRRRRASRWLALVMAALALATIAVGVASSTGLVTSLAGQHVLWVHIALAVLLAPMVVWHAVARGTRPRRPGGARTPGRGHLLSRRALLRAGTLGALAVAGYAAVEVAVDVVGLPGRRRRFTGSHEVGSLRPAAMPSTIWLDDRTPDVATADWRVTVTGGGELTVGQLRRHPARTTRRVTLDCTSGWFSTQDWTGVPLSALLTPVAGAGARSVLVRSATGYATASRWTTWTGCCSPPTPGTHRWPPGTARRCAWSRRAGVASGG